MSDRHIPQDIISEILIRCPGKSLLRFRCVCKPWRILIDTPEFTKLHLDQTLKSNRLLVSAPDGIHLAHHNLETILASNKSEFHKINLPVNHPSLTRVMGSCNGLVLLSAVGGRTNALWNPCTRTLKQLPRFGQWRSMRYYDMDFGYNHVHDDYKVVRIMIHQFSSSPNETLDVYSSNSNKFSKSPVFPYSLVVENTGVLVAGSLHWNACTSSNRKGKLIVGFNLTTHEMQLVPQPDCCLENQKASLAVLGGNLCLTYYIKESYDIDIWIMKDYGNKESWTKIASLANYAPLFLRPISFSMCGKHILLARKEDEALFWYDLEEKSVRKVKFQGLLGIIFQYNVYCESLVRCGPYY